MANTSTIIKRKKTRNPSLCQICESSALYSYYGVISCSSCKIFFRRHSENGLNTLKCYFNNECDINLNNRHLCTFCRLRKCFEVGMKIEMIRRSITNPKQKILVKTNQIQQIPRLNLLDKDISTLDQNQWTLLSNLTNTYDHSYLFSLANRLKNSNNFFTIIDQTIAEELLTGFYKVAGKCIRLNNDINQLSSDDRSILLHTAADNVTCLGGIFIHYHSNLINHETFWNYLGSLYGKQTMERVKWTSHYSTQDMILFKLALALFAFSTNSKTIHENISMEYSGIRQILQIENKYAELTWKYLIYKYNHNQAIRIFIDLIRWLLSVTVYMSYAHNIQAHVDDIQSLIQQTELTFAIDDIDKIVNTNYL